LLRFAHGHRPILQPPKVLGSHPQKTGGLPRRERRSSRAILTTERKRGEKS
jgi:hypothetical protein